MNNRTCNTDDSGVIRRRAAASGVAGEYRDARVLACLAMVVFAVLFWVGFFALVLFVL